jgi:hypothetical protein
MEAEPSRLRELLAALHAELARNPPADERSGELIQRLRADLAHYEATGETPAPATPGMPPLSTPAAGDAAPVRHPHLRDRLQELFVALEGSHPQLAVTVEQTMVALSNMGL